MIRLCRLDELKPGGSRGFDAENTGVDTVFAVRRGDEVRVYRNLCPHAGARLEYRKDRFLSPDGKHIVCYAHGAVFDPDTGVCTDGPCLGQSLEAVPCLIESGWIWIEP